MRKDDLDASDTPIERRCKSCGINYVLDESTEQSEYFEPPWNYQEGCDTYCLNCWLVGEEACSDTLNDVHVQTADCSMDDMIIEWCGKERFEPLKNGDVHRFFQGVLDEEMHLVIMPIARVEISETIVFPDPVIFYPKGQVQLESLNVQHNSEHSKSLSEVCSAASGVDIDKFMMHTLIAFPARFNWATFQHQNHKQHLELLRDLSASIDQKCLNLIRYRNCRLHLVDDLPAHPGQMFTSNRMMAGALFYNHTLHVGRMIGGAAFTHAITRGLGLSFDQPEWDSLPEDGEVGKIALHALSLYTSLLEAGDLTAKFMQALALLEFLADPNDFQKWEKVKKIIARYVTQEPSEYKRLLDRFLELTGKRDPITNQFIGYRTRVVHMGERIEHLVPEPSDRQELFKELDHYIRAVVDHLLRHSGHDFEHYVKHLRPKEPGNNSEELPF